MAAPALAQRDIGVSATFERVTPEFVQTNPGPQTIVWRLTIANVTTFENVTVDRTNYWPQVLDTQANLEAAVVQTHVLEGGATHTNGTYVLPKGSKAISTFTYTLPVTTHDQVSARASMRLQRTDGNTAFTSGTTVVTPDGPIEEVTSEPTRINYHLVETVPSPEEDPLSSIQNWIGGNVWPSDLSHLLDYYESGGRFIDLLGDTTGTGGGATPATWTAVEDRQAREAAGIFNVLDYGAENAGVTDSGPGINAAIVAAAGKGRVVLPAGTYRLDTPVTAATATHIEGLGDVEVQQNFAVGSAPMFSLNSEESSIRNLRIVGTVTEANYVATHHAGFTAASTADRHKYAAVFVNGNRSLATEIQVSGFMVGVSTNGVFECTISNIDIIGFFTGATLAVEWNLHLGVWVQGGGRNSIRNVKARDIGSAVIVGNSSTDVTISDITALRFRDHCVYISSGIGVDMVNITGRDNDNNSGSLITARGDHITGSNIVGTNVNLGILCSGLGTARVDGQWGGVGHSYANVQITGSQNAGFKSSGFEATGFHVTDVTLTNFELVDCCNVGDSSIDVTADNLKISNGIIRDCKSAIAAITLVGSGNSPTPAGNVITGVTIRNQANEGMRLVDQDSMLIYGNIGQQTPAALVRWIRLVSNVTNSSIYGNRTDGGRVQEESGAGNDGNMISGNVGEFADFKGGANPVTWA